MLPHKPSESREREPRQLIEAQGAIGPNMMLPDILTQIDGSQMSQARPSLVPSTSSRSFFVLTPRLATAGIGFRWLFAGIYLWGSCGCHISPQDLDFGVGSLRGLRALPAGYAGFKVYPQCLLEWGQKYLDPQSM